MEDIRESMVISAKIGHQLYRSTIDSTNSVGEGLLAGMFNVCLLAKTAPVDIPLEDLIMMLRHVHGMVSEADAAGALDREAAKYGIQ